MSISIKNLIHECRDVGKTIKSTKKYYMWEFVLNGTFHKVEVFHSKLSGKKKLCLDAKVIIEDKSYQSNFTYSFKLEKHYFNISQIDDKYDLRIDNRSFDIWIGEERSGRLKSSEPQNYRKEERALSKDPVQKFSNAKNVIAELRRSVQGTSSQKRNTDDEFFNETDFNFETANTNNRNKSMQKSGFGNNGNADRKDTNISSFANFNNEFSNSSNNFNEKNSRKNVNNYENSNSGNKGQLLDINDIIGPSKGVSQVDNKEILKDLAFPESKRASSNQINMDIYNHNKNVLYNLNLNNITEEPFNPSQGGCNFDNQNNQFNQINQNVTTRTSLNNINNTINFPNNNVNDQVFFNNSRGFVNKPINNYNQEINSNNYGFSNLQTVTQVPRNNSFTVNPTGSSPVFNSNVNTNTTSSKAQISTENVNINSFKKQLLDCNLINPDNILEEKKKTTTVTDNNSSNYNFSFKSGVPMNYMNTDNYSNHNNSNSNYVGNNFNNNPTNMNGYGMISTGQQNFAQNQNYGNMNNFNNGNQFQNNFDGYFQNYQNPSNMNNMNMQRKSTPFDFQQ